MKEFILGLEDIQRAGLIFTGKKNVESRTETEAGIQRVIVRLIKYSYDLYLQDLSVEEVKEFLNIIETAEINNTRITIPAQVFTGYLGEYFADVEMNFDTNNFTSTEEEGRFDIKLSVTEVVIPDVA